MTKPKEPGGLFEGLNVIVRKKIAYSLSSRV